MSLPVATRYRFPALTCFLIGGTGYVLAQDRVGFIVIIAIILVGILGAYSSFLLLMVYVGLIMAWAVWVSHQVYEDLSFVFPLALFALPIAAVGHLLNRARTRLLVTRKANEELELRQAEIRELERQSLARDLHDVVAHQLTVISLVSGSRLRSDDTEKLRTALKEVNGTSREALVELRTLLKVLRGAEDDPVLFGSPRNSLSNLGLEDGVEQLGTRCANWVSRCMSPWRADLPRASGPPLWSQCSRSCRKRVRTSSNMLSRNRMCAYEFMLAIRKPR